MTAQLTPQALEAIGASGECTAPIFRMAERAVQTAALDAYDAGLLNDFGGGNVDWWQDYIRAELGRAHDFYESRIADISGVQQ